MSTPLDPASVITARELAARGYSQSQIRTLVSSGRLRQLRRGWYSSPGADASLERAVLAGGSLTCVSALATIWAPPHRGLHIRVPANSRRSTRVAGDIVAHRLDRSISVTRAVDPDAYALATAARCVANDEWVAMAEALFRRGHHPEELLIDMLRVDPDHGSQLVRWMSRTSRLSESPSESLLRVGLRSINLPVRPQVLIGRDRVDLLVGDRLVIECDSRAHHTGVERYAADRERDVRLSLQGFHVLRFTYEQIVHDRARVCAAVQELCARRIHRWGSTRRRAA